MAGLVVYVPAFGAMSCPTCPPVATAPAGHTPSLRNIRCPRFGASGPGLTPGVQVNVAGATYTTLASVGAAAGAVAARELAGQVAASAATRATRVVRRAISVRTSVAAHSRAAIFRLGHPIEGVGRTRYPVR